MQKRPENGFFFSEEFFSTLKGQSVNKEDYDNSKKLLILLKMRNHSDLNDLYNVQDVILVMVITENRYQEMQNKTSYNPRKINSATQLSSCIQKEQSKCILAFPTNNSHVEIFEKTLSGGFSCVSSCLSFDTELLMPNLIEKDFNKMIITQSFKAFKRNDLKLFYKVKFDDQKKD